MQFLKFQCSKIPQYERNNGNQKMASVGELHKCRMFLDKYHKCLILVVGKSVTTSSLVFVVYILLKGQCGVFFSLL